MTAYKRIAVLMGGRSAERLDFEEALDALYGPKASLSVSRHDGYSVVEMIVPRV